MNYLSLHTMKYFAFIMTLLILALSVMPCADGFIDGKPMAEIAENQSHSEEDHPDACSPLCHFSCCAGFSINHFIPCVKNRLCYRSSPTISFLIPEITGASFSFWQPPRYS